MSNASQYIGKLVVVSHWQDFDLMDAVQVGILESIGDGYFYIVGSRRGWRHCRPVSETEISA